ncbi:MAG: hypothetical protein BMS9Abin29_0011 [Gemmatimonadota bacterium]|nr:MAG: hypothetical protein BMS9Abin29_0011 [Gemmatimonadota bacterium]
MTGWLRSDRAWRGCAFLAIPIVVSSVGCSSPQPEARPESTASDGLTWNTAQDSTDRVLVIEGFEGPEAVRYDPDLDVYFVSNFGGDEEGDGFISRVTAEGEIDSLRFLVSGDLAPLNEPRGMFIVGEVLWVADATGVHGFDRRTGEQRSFVDLMAFDPGFPNDVSATPDGVLYVTDTGRSRIYRIIDGVAEVAADSADLNQPNGITWDPNNARFLLAPWRRGRTYTAWDPDLPDSLILNAARTPGGHIDGLEFLGGLLIAASQDDLTLHGVVNGMGHPLIRTPGRAADIAIDTRRRRVAVPYISLDRVDVWQLPEG